MACLIRRRFSALPFVAGLPVLEVLIRVPGQSQFEGAPSPGRGFMARLSEDRGLAVLDTSKQASRDKIIKGTLVRAAHSCWRHVQL